MKINALALGYTGAILGALWMLILSILNALGVNQGAVEQMQNWHMLYTPDVVGTITGMIEAAIFSFVALYIFGLIYNRFVK